MVLDLPTDIEAVLKEKARESGVAPVQYVTTLLREVLAQGGYETSGFADENDTPISQEEAAQCFPAFCVGWRM